MKKYRELVDAARIVLAGSDRVAAKKSYRALHTLFQSPPSPPPRPLTRPRSTRRTAARSSSAPIGTEADAAVAEHLAAYEDFWISVTYFGLHADFGYASWIEFALKERAPAAISVAVGQGRKTAHSTRLVASLLRLHERWSHDFYRRLVDAGLSLPLVPGYTFVEQLAKLSGLQTLTDVIETLPTYYAERPPTVRYNQTTAQREACGTRELSVKDLQAFIARLTAIDQLPEYREPALQQKKRKHLDTPRPVERSRRARHTSTQPSSPPFTTWSLQEPDTETVLREPELERDGEDPSRLWPESDVDTEIETGFQEPEIERGSEGPSGFWPENEVDTEIEAGFQEPEIGRGSEGPSGVWQPDTEVDTAPEMSKHGEHTGETQPTLAEIIAAGEKTPGEFWAKLATSKARAKDAVAAQDEANKHLEQLAKTITADLGVESNLVSLQTAKARVDAEMAKLTKVATLFQKSRQELKELLGDDTGDYRLDLASDHDTKYLQHQARHAKINAAISDLSESMTMVAQTSQAARAAVVTVEEAHKDWNHFLACMNSVAKVDMMSLVP